MQFHRAPLGCLGEPWGRAPQGAFPMAGLEVSGQIPLTQKGHLTDSEAAFDTLIFSFLKVSPVSFSDAISPWFSFLWVLSFCPLCVKVRSGLLGESSLPLTPHTLPGYNYPHHHFSMENDTKGGLMTPRSPLQLRPLLCNASPVELGPHLSGIP